jgi:hypothetical protein
MMDDMGPDDDAGEDGVDFLEVGRPRVRPGPARASRHLPRWVGLLLSGVLVATVVALQVHHGSKRSARPTPPAPTSSRSSGSPVPSTGPATQPVTVTELGHPLLGVTSGWELLARGDGVVVRIQPALGRVTRTAVPNLLSTGSVSFLAGPKEAMVRPLDRVPGYLVPDGKPPGQILESLAQGRNGPVLPGPQADLVLAQAPAAAAPVFVLSAFDGLPSGVQIPVPPGTSPLAAQADGSGYLLFQRAHGLYDARPGSLRRISTGTLVAAGRTGWLTRECRADAHCVTVLVDRATRSRRIIGPGLSGSDDQPGAIAPDGRTAAVFRVSARSKLTLSLLDLRTGRVRPLALPVGPSSRQGSIAWSPDSRWLLTADARGRLEAVAAATGKVTVLHDARLTLPALTQVVIRDTSAG